MVNGCRAEATKLEQPSLKAAALGVPDAENPQQGVALSITACLSAWLPVLFMAGSLAASLAQCRTKWRLATKAILTVY